MNLFHIIDDAFVILRSRGVYRQAKLYRRGSDLFAGFGSGFIRLGYGTGTSCPSVSWIELSPGIATLDMMGRPAWAGDAT